MVNTDFTLTEITMGDGFNVIRFEDLYGKACNIQESSISLTGSNAIWFGIENADPKIMTRGGGWVSYPVPEDVLMVTRMHLSREQVKQLIPILQEFVDTGYLMRNKLEGE